MQFFEELVQGPDTSSQHTEVAKKSLNKKTKFVYSDSSEDDEEDGDDDNEKSEENLQKSPEVEDKPTSAVISELNHEILNDKNLVHQKEEENSLEDQRQEGKDNEEENMKNHGNDKTDTGEPPIKKQCVEIDPGKSPNLTTGKREEKSVDKLIEAELAELGDKSKVSELPVVKVNSSPVHFL